MTDIAQQIADEFAQEGLWDSCASKIRAELAQLRARAAKAADEEAIRRDEMERCCGMLIDLFGPDSTAEAYIRGRDRKGGG